MTYTDLVVQHFRRPENKGRHPDPNGSAEGANPLCGDRIRIEIEVSGARVISAMFTGDACAICVASASLLTSRVREMPVAEVMAIGDGDVIALLEGAVPPARRRCATLPAETLRQALQPFVPLSIVSPIVLAAGAGRRFGGDKMLALVDGVPMIRLVATAYAELCGRVTVVIGGDDRLRRALDGVAAAVVVNANAGEGIASSIRAGVARNADERALMIALGDEPRVDRALVATVMRTWFTTLAPIVVPRYNGEPGHPVLFTAAVYPDLLALTGDRGARGLIEKHRANVVPVDVAGPRPVDIDTTNDLERL